jgi:monothiol glutaredoxin
MTDQATFNHIQQYITENSVVLYMKGTAEMPQCGFSSVVVQLLTHLEVPFKIVNVLADPNVRDGIKKFSNWPTIPQLYIKGEFVGGCDIVKEMYQSGELQELLKSKEILAA